MINEKINLKDYFKEVEHDYYLESFCQSNFVEFSENRKRKTVLVLPGGAYAFCSNREADPIAIRLLGHDINAFVLRYQVAPFTYPHPLLEVFAAIAYIRKNADKYNVDVNQIAVMGFSAGGHLAASVACYHEDQYYADRLHVSLNDIRVNACLLGYPVITRDDRYTHMESIQNVSQNKEELKEKFSIEKHITPSFPKTFMWHTSEDQAVSVMNSILLAKALAENKVPFEYHVFPVGAHGESLADQSVYGDDFGQENLDYIAYNQNWVNQVIHFIKEYMK